MPVWPTAFDPTGGVLVWHDEQNHGGAVAFAAVAFGRTVDGAVDPGTIVLACPVCGAASSHPVGGGCDAPRVELLFWRTWRRRAAALGFTAVQAKARLKARIVAAEGPDRWRLEALATEDDPIPDGG